MICQAHVTWGTNGNDFNTSLPADKNVTDIAPATVPTDWTIFYLRVKSGMIAERIKGYLKLSDWENLHNNTVDYAWKGSYGIENDEPTMLYHLLRQCNPSTCVGVSNIKTQL